MSTRCQIGIYRSKEQKIDEPEVLLYKHCDGYPKEMEPLLLPFLVDFKKKRGINDCEYLGAWLIHELIALHIKHEEEFIRNNHFLYQDIFNTQTPTVAKDFLGHGVCKVFHTDI